MKKLITVVAAITCIFLLNSFTGKQDKQQQQLTAKNLKILPKNISKDSLLAVMKSYSTALGVSCRFCHSPAKDDINQLDFASDANEHKIVARRMMAMTDSINTHFFPMNPHKRLLAGTSCVTCHIEKHLMFQVTCQTCHNGNKMPVTLELKLKP